MVSVACIAHTSVRAGTRKGMKKEWSKLKEGAAPQVKGKPLHQFNHHSTKLDPDVKYFRSIPPHRHEAFFSGTFLTLIIMNCYVKHS